MADRAGLGARFSVTPRGTHDSHVGEGTDPRTVAVLAAAGCDGSAHHAARLDELRR